MSGIISDEKSDFRCFKVYDYLFLLRVENLHCSELSDLKMFICFDELDRSYANTKIAPKTRKS